MTTDRTIENITNQPTAITLRNSSTLADRKAEAERLVTELNEINRGRISLLKLIDLINLSVESMADSKDKNDKRKLGDCEKVMGDSIDQYKAWTADMIARVKRLNTGGFDNDEQTKEVLELLGGHLLDVMNGKTRDFDWIADQLELGDASSDTVRERTSEEAKNLFEKYDFSMTMEDIIEAEKRMNPGSVVDYNEVVNGYHHAYYAALYQRE